MVVAGGGPAGWSCAFALRERGYEGTIELLCEEGRSPYDRTMVSKDCLERSPGEHELSLSAEPAYAGAGVTLRLGARASALDVHERAVRLADGTTVRYDDALVIATGGRPRLPAPLACAGVHTLRSLADARRLGEALATAERLVIVGGGFISGEVATAAVRRGLEVVVLEALGAPLERIVGAEAGARVAELHRRAGVDVRVGALARRIVALGDGDGHVVELLDGTAISADAVLVATGMEAAIEWLRGTPGLVLDGGVTTDERCRTGVPGVYAAGDCARWLNVRTGGLSRVEHWDTAVKHGQAAAAAITGSTEPFVPVPFVWSMQQGSRLQWVGEGSGWDRVELDETAALRSLLARYTRAGELCAAFAIDEPRGIAAARRELARLYRTDAVAAG